MKKIYLLFMSFICLSTVSVFAESPCDNQQMQSRMMKQQKMHNNCNQPCENSQVMQHRSYQHQMNKQCPSECFLCTKAHTATLFKEIGLSETQICTAMKIQEKYEQEVLSLNERLHCEKVKLYQLEKSCSKKSEIRKQKRVVKNLKKTKKEICKCYERQFKSLLSNPQKKAYNKHKKC